MIIYFNEKKEAHAYEISDYIATIDMETWEKYSDTQAGVDWDIIDGKFTPLKNIQEIDEERAIAVRKQERYGLYLTADEHIAKCDNFIELGIEQEKYTALKRQLLEYKMAVRMTQDGADYPHKVTYPSSPIMED